MQTESIPGYELQIGEFRGPLDKLLELIDEKKLEITRLNIAEVTADFLGYLEKLEHQIHHRELADFVVVAARLILIKSHALLPHLQLSDEEEEDIADLERRLRFYKEFRMGEGIIQGLWGEHVILGRPFLANVPQGFYLSQKVKPSELLERIKELAFGLEELQKLEEREVSVVSLEEKIGELLTSIKTMVRASFNNLRSGREKSEVVVMFLALLHLLKDSSVSIVQEELFADIEIVEIENG